MTLVAGDIKGLVQGLKERVRCGGMTIAGPDSGVGIARIVTAPARTC